MVPSAPHATDMEHIKPEAKNDTLTTGCPATKLLTIALGAAMPVFVHGKQSVYGRLGRHCGCTARATSGSGMIWMHVGDWQVQQCSTSLLFRIASCLSEESVHGV